LTKKDTKAIEEKKAKLAVRYKGGAKVDAVINATEQAVALGSSLNYLVDAANAAFSASGGGHVIYPFLPPPNSDGSYNTTTVTANGQTYLKPVGLTCYQLALEYLDGLANTWATVPIIVPPKAEVVTGWQTTLTALGSPLLSAGWSTSL
jgi:hypothetical protein